MLTVNRRSFLQATLLGSGSVLAGIPWLGWAGSLKGFEETSRVPATPLDEKEIGHIRRFGYLARLKPGELARPQGGGFSGNGIKESFIRCQIADMACTLASVQYNRTPAYREYYQSTLLELFNRLLEPVLWQDWINHSRRSVTPNRRGGAPKPSHVDPIKRHGVAYGGHILHIAGLYESLYQEDRFTKPDSIELDLLCNTWGTGRQRYRYDIPVLSRIFHDEIKAQGLARFSVDSSLIAPGCPHHAVLGLLASDRLTGQEYGAETRRCYLDAIACSPAGKFAGHSSSASWQAGRTGLYLHAWAPEYARATYPVQRDQQLPGLFDISKSGLPRHLVSFHSGIGYWLPYAAEMGDGETVERLLAFAEEYLDPVWSDGQYFYSNNNGTVIDGTGVVSLDSTQQGTAVIPLGRLNVEDGLLRLHSSPWTPQQLAEPHIADVDYEAAGVSEAHWSGNSATLNVSFLPGSQALARSQFTIRGLEHCQEIRVQRDRRSVVTVARETQEREGVVRDEEGRIHVTFDPRVAATFSVQVANQSGTT